MRKPRLGQNLTTRLMAVSILVTLFVGALWAFSGYQSYKDSLERSRQIYKAGKEELIAEVVNSIKQFIYQNQIETAGRDRYESAAETLKLKQRSIELIERIRFGDDGYVFAGSWDGLSLSGPAKGKNVWDISDVNGVKVVQELIAAAKRGSGFLTYHVPAATGAEPIEKTSYVVGIPEWRWYVGAGFDLVKFEQEIVSLQEATQKRFRMILIVVLAVVVVSLGFMIFFARREYTKVLHDHSDFMRFFDNVEEGHLEIDPASLKYAEFEEIGRAANRMVARRMSAEEKLQISERNSLAQERLLDSIFRNIPVGLIIKNRGHVVERVNPTFLSWIGRSAKDIIGKTVAEAGFVDSNFDVDAMNQQEDLVFQTGQIQRRKVDQKFVDGKVHSLHSTRFPIHDELGNIVKIGSVNVDQTELIEAIDSATAANQAKTQFLANMSHELRTPLNAVIGFSQMIALDPDGRLSNLQKEYLGYVMNSGNHLLEVVTEILDLSIIETGRFQYDISEVRVSRTVEHCLTMVSPLIDRNAITITNNLENESTLIASDETRLKQVLLNLISNAIKYNRVEGDLIIDGEIVEGSRYRISVTDTGHGIPASEQENVFKMFHQIGRSPNVSAEGTGIGLYVSKLLIDGMGGRIGFESTLDVGSTFWIELPLA